MKTVVTCLAVLALAGIAQAARAQEPETYAFQLEVGNDRCTLTYPRADDEQLYFIMTAKGMITAGVRKAEWESLVDGKDADSEAFNTTLDFKDVGKTTSKWGGYQNGFWQGTWATWDQDSHGPGSTDELLSLLAKAQVVTVRFEGQTLGTFDMKNKGFAATALTSCVKNLGSS